MVKPPVPIARLVTIRTMPIRRVVLVKLVITVIKCFKAQIHRVKYVYRVPTLRPLVYQVPRVVTIVLPENIPPRQPAQVFLIVLHVVLESIKMCQALPRVVNVPLDLAMKTQVRPHAMVCLLVPTAGTVKYVNAKRVIIAQAKPRIKRPASQDSTRPKDLFHASPAHLACMPTLLVRLLV